MQNLLTTVRLDFSSTGEGVWHPSNGGLCFWYLVLTSQGMVPLENWLSVCLQRAECTIHVLYSVFLLFSSSYMFSFLKSTALFFCFMFPTGFFCFPHSCLLSYPSSVHGGEVIIFCLVIAISLFLTGGASRNIECASRTCLVDWISCAVCCIAFLEGNRLMLIERWCSLNYELNYSESVTWDVCFPCRRILLLMCPFVDDCLDVLSVWRGLLFSAVCSLESLFLNSYWSNNLLKCCSVMTKGIKMFSNPLKGLIEKIYLSVLFSKASWQCWWNF